MKLFEFITLLKEGSLHQVSHITQDSLISFTNLGIQTISDEFDLLKKTIIINVLNNVTTYTLPLDFETVNSITTSGNYWRDFNGEISPQIKEFEVGVNIVGDYNSVFIHNNLTLTVPYPITGQTLLLDYKASVPTLISTTEVLPIANQYIIILMLYVTFLGFLHSLGASHQDTLSSLKMYKDGVISILESGTYIPNKGFNNKFNDRGFV